MGRSPVLLGGKAIEAAWLSDGWAAEFTRAQRAALKQCQRSDRFYERIQRILRYRCELLPGPGRSLRVGRISHSDYFGVVLPVLEAEVI